MGLTAQNDDKIMMKGKKCNNELCENEKKDVKYMKCSRCLEASYCSQNCQRADWKRHKLICQPPHTHSGGCCDEHRDKKMRVNEALESVLKTVDKAHSAYKMYAYSLSQAFGDVRFEEVKRHQCNLMLELKLNEFDAWKTVMYMEGDHLVYTLREKEMAICNGRKIVPGLTSCMFPPLIEKKDKKELTLANLASKSGSTLKEVTFPYQPNLQASDLIAFVKKCPNLEVLDLTGSCYGMEDSVLKVLPKHCPNLRELHFGQDNKFIAALEITADVLASCVSKLPQLRRVSINQHSKDGKPYVGGSNINTAMLKAGFKVKCCPNAEDIKETFCLHEHQYWRHAIENGVTSACYYLREI